MFHHECITQFCEAKDKNKCPRCNSDGSYIDCQSYDEQITMCMRAINGDNVKGNDNDDTTTTVVTGGRGVGDYVGDNNDDDVANDNNNNDNDNGNYDEQQTYNNEDACAICFNKFLGTTPEALSVTSYEEKCKANIVPVLSIISCTHKFHRLCWMRYETNISKTINYFNFLRVVSLFYITFILL